MVVCVHRLHGVHCKSTYNCFHPSCVADGDENGHWMCSIKVMSQRVNELFATYDDVLCDIADWLAPAHTVYSRVQPLAPWFDSECREIRRDCRRLERRYRRSNGDIDRSNFTAALQRKHASFVAKKNKYWTDLFLAERGSPVKLWQLLSKMLRRDKELDSSSASPTLSADQFIQFFSHKVETIRRDTENSTVHRRHLHLRGRPLLR